MANTNDSAIRNFSSRQIKELLALASTPAVGEGNWLFELGDRERLEPLLTEMCTADGHSGAALLDSICSPETPVEALKAVKNLAKGLAAKFTGKPQTAAAALLYHLAIASAFAFHGTAISSRSSGEQLALFQELSAELPDVELTAIFKKAVSRAALVRP